jgi:hypothetical protein
MSSDVRPAARSTREKKNENKSFLSVLSSTPPGRTAVAPASVRQS